MFSVFVYTIDDITKPAGYDGYGEQETLVQKYGNNVRCEHWGEYDILQRIDFKSILANIRGKVGILSNISCHGIQCTEVSSMVQPP